MRNRVSTGSTEDARPRLAGAGTSTWPLYVLFFLSGMIGLVYEVMWTRSFCLIMGSTTRAAATVLAAFFGGMALGYLLGGRLARRRGSSLLRYGLAEILIALGALGVGAWLHFYHHIYPTLYQSRLGGGTGLTIIKLALAFVALAPPCIAMGATLPLMSRAVVAHAGHLGRRLGGVYALNTIGATAGVLMAGFFLPALVGTTNTVHLGVVGNIVIGVAAVIIWARRRGVPVEPNAEDDPLPAQARRRPTSHVILAASVSGFGTLSLEVLYTRLLANASDCSVHSFALMLATFLVFLALGALVVSVWGDRIRRPWLLLAWTQAMAAGVIMAAPRVFLILTTTGGDERPDSVM